MAKKKQEIILQVSIDDDAQWQSEIAKRGLLVVDVYQDWAGPCKALVNTFKRLKTDIDDELLNFAIAKADSVKSLSAYCGNSEPCFLFFGSGHLVAVLRGANPPLLELMIKTELEKEKHCLEGAKDRTVIVDPVLALKKAVEAEEKKRQTEMVEIDQEVSVVIVKPELITLGALKEVIENLKNDDFTILYEKEIVVEPEDAKIYYEFMEDDPTFNEMVDNLSSNPSTMLIVIKNKENSIEDVANKVGPLNYDKAREFAPESLVAIFGSSNIKNGLEAATSPKQAAKMLERFMPEFQRPKVVVHKPGNLNLLFQSNDEEMTEAFYKRPENALLVISPSVWTEYGDKPINDLIGAGFEVLIKREVYVNKESAKNFYKNSDDEDYSNALIDEMTSKPCCVLLLRKRDGADAIAKLESLFGSSDIRQILDERQTSLMGQYLTKSGQDYLENPVDYSEPVIPGFHYSKTLDELETDYKFFMPAECVCMILKPEVLPNKEEIKSMITGIGMEIYAEKEVVLQEEVVKLMLDKMKNEDFDLKKHVEHMTSGPSLALLIRGEKANNKIHKLVGPEDPDIAAEVQPQSIRAIFARDMVRNAVIATGEKQGANDWISLIWDPDAAKEMVMFIDAVREVSEKYSTYSSSSGDFEVNFHVSRYSQLDSNNDNSIRTSYLDSPDMTPYMKLMLRSKVNQEIAIRRGVEGLYRSQGGDKDIISFFEEANRPKPSQISWFVRTSHYELLINSALRLESSLSSNANIRRSYFNLSRNMRPYRNTSNLKKERKRSRRRTTSSSNRNMSNVFEALGLSLANILRNNMIEKRECDSNKCVLDGYKLTDQVFIYFHVSKRNSCVSLLTPFLTCPRHHNIRQKNRKIQKVFGGPKGQTNSMVDNRISDMSGEKRVYPLDINEETKLHLVINKLYQNLCLCGKPCITPSHRVKFAYIGSSTMLEIFYDTNNVAKINIRLEENYQLEIDLNEFCE